MELAKYLSTHYAKDQDPITHTRIGDKHSKISGGKYNIMNNNEFLEAYYNHIFINNNKEYLTEKQLTGNSKRVVLDIDLRYSADISQRQHTKEHIIDLIDAYLRQLAELYDFDDGYDLDIYVMEKPNVNQLENKTKDGIHLIFNICLNVKYQMLIRKQLLHILENLFEDLPLTNSIEDVLDEGIVKGSVNWQLYGSSKPNHQTYEITYIFNYKYNKNKNDWDFITKDLKSLDMKKDIFKLSVRSTDIPILIIDKEIAEDTTEENTEEEDDDEEEVIEPPITLSRETINKYIDGMSDECWRCGKGNCAFKIYCALKKVGAKKCDIKKLMMKAGKEYDNDWFNQVWRQNTEKYSESLPYIKSKSSYRDPVLPTGKCLINVDGIQDPNCYENVMKDFEKNNCKVNDVFIRENDDGTIEEYKKCNFSIRYEEIRYTSGKKNKQFLSAWYEDPQKRRYDAFGCFPKNCPKSIYNIWRPFQITLHLDIQLNDRMKLSLNYFKNHIDVLCGRDKTVYNFVMMWLAQMFQYPENKTIELIFISKEGAGKGLFLNFLKTIMGTKKVFETTDPQRDVFGSFNGMMKNAFLVVFNEANKSNFFNQNDKKKSLITDSVININQKGIPQYEMSSYHRFMTFTNNPDPTQKNNRRDISIRSSDEMIDNSAYFDEGFSYANDKDCCKYIYDYLMKYPTKSNIVKNDIPITAYDTELIEQQESPEIGFLKWYALCNYLEGQEVVKKVSSRNLFEQFDEWRKDFKLFEVGAKAFTMKIAFLKLNSITKNVRRVNKVPTNLYIININSLIKELKIEELLDMEEFEDNEGNCD